MVTGEITRYYIFYYFKHPSKHNQREKSTITRIAYHAAFSFLLVSFSPLSSYVKQKKFNMIM